MENNRLPNVILCVNKLGYIGKDGDLLYNIREDLLRFKRLTINNVVIMGRKTLESLPNSLPLKDRINIVITRNKKLLLNNHNDSNLIYIDTIEKAISLANNKYPKLNHYIIGGAQIYNYVFENGLFNVVLATIVNDETIGDTKVFLNTFSVIESRFSRRNEYGYKHTYVNYIKL